MTVILLRHGRSTSNTAHVLAGRSEGVDLDERGREQAEALVDRLGSLPIRALVSSPLLRCMRTIEPLAAALGVEPIVDERLSEVDYGQWTGRKRWRTRWTTRHNCGLKHWSDLSPNCAMTCAAQ